MPHVPRAVDEPAGAPRAVAVEHVVERQRIFEPDAHDRRLVKLRSIATDLDDVLDYIEEVADTANVSLASHGIFRVMPAPTAQPHFSSG